MGSGKCHIHYTRPGCVGVNCREVSSGIGHLCVVLEAAGRTMPPALDYNHNHCSKNAESRRLGDSLRSGTGRPKGTITAQTTRRSKDRSAAAHPPSVTTGQAPKQARNSSDSFHPGGSTRLNGFERDTFLSRTRQLCSHGSLRFPFQAEGLFLFWQLARACCRNDCRCIFNELRSAISPPFSIRSTLEPNPLTLPLASKSSTTTTIMQSVRMFATLLAFGQYHHLSSLQSMAPDQSYRFSCCLHFGQSNSCRIPLQEGTRCQPRHSR